MVLATATRGGRPSARVVLYKGVRDDAIRFFTNYGSRKAHELDRNRLATVVFYWPEEGRQVRISGRVRRTSAAESDEYWNARARESQIGAHASRQSHVMKSWAAISPPRGPGCRPLPRKTRAAPLELGRLSSGSGHDRVLDREDGTAASPRALHACRKALEAQGALSVKSSPSDRRVHLGGLPRESRRGLPAGCRRSPRQRRELDAKRGDGDESFGDRLSRPRGHQVALICAGSRRSRKPSSAATRRWPRRTRSGSSGSRRPARSALTRARGRSLPIAKRRLDPARLSASCRDTGGNPRAGSRTRDAPCLRRRKSERRFLAELPSEDAVRALGRIRRAGATRARRDGDREVAGSGV